MGMKVRVFLILLLFASVISADQFTARVVRVPDADTIVVLHDGKGETIRLNGIDCPELREARGARAQEYVQQRLQGKNISFKTYGKDKLNRTLADIFLESGKLFNQDLVLKGHCRWGRSPAMRN